MTIINRITSTLAEIRLPISSLSMPQEGLYNYQEITRRVPSHELQPIEQKLSSMPTDQKQNGIKDLVTLVEKGDWDKINFADPNTPLYALEAVKQGQLQSFQFGTVQMFWSSFDFHKTGTVHKVPLFLPDGAINPQAHGLIERTMFYQRTAVLPEPLMNEFFEKMRSKPVSEHYFLLSPRTIVIEDNRKYDTVLDFLQDLFNFNIFGICGDQEMVPSFSMMQALLDVQYEDQALQLNVALGLSSEDDLENLTKRDVAVAFPGVTLPADADDIPAPAHIFSYHDGVYHAYLGSAVPPEHRVLFNKVGHIAETCIGGGLRAAFADREFPLYSQLEEESDLIPIFWETVHNLIKKGRPTDEQKNTFFDKALQELGDDPVTKSGKHAILHIVKRFIKEPPSSRRWA